MGNSRSALEGEVVGINPSMWAFDFSNRWVLFSVRKRTLHHSGRMSLPSIYQSNIIPISKTQYLSPFASLNLEPFSAISDAQPSECPNPAKQTSLSLSAIKLASITAAL